MKISIRKSKHQKEDLTDAQLEFSCKCIAEYKKLGYKTYYLYSGTINNEKMKCDVYKTKTQISAVVYHG